MLDIGKSIKMQTVGSSKKSRGENSMLFNSYQFLLFFPIVLLVFFIMPGRGRRIWLLICSLFFYACWNLKYLILLIISIVTTYLCGIFLEKTSGRRKRILVMTAGLVINFSSLFFFKYAAFFMGVIEPVLEMIGISSAGSRFDFILPVGISFYTFQGAGYIIDVYRQDIKAEKNPVKYALFISFFPQLVAGPIERSKNILFQIDNICEKKVFDIDRFKTGFIYMMWGLFLKMVIADRISVISDKVFDGYYSYGTFILILGAVAFSIQIYCDFASYSIIAVGAARMLGFTLMENFETPYFSLSIKEFWRRWHISLSTWFRDYVYFPLGGSRCSKIKKYRNIMITFLISGLWHGANWTFVIWGGLHGIYQITGDILTPVRNKFNSVFSTDTNNFGYKLSRVAWTFLLTSFAWIFFRAESLKHAFTYILRMFTRFDPWALTDKSIYSLGLDITEMHILWAALLIMAVISVLRYKRKIPVDRFICLQGPVFQILSVYALIMSIMIFGKYGPSEALKAFIYFQF